MLCFLFFFDAPWRCPHSYTKGSPFSFGQIRASFAEVKGQLFPATLCASLSGEKDTCIGTSIKILTWRENTEKKNVFYSFVNRMVLKWKWGNHYNHLKIKSREFSPLSCYFQLDIPLSKAYSHAARALSLIRKNLYQVMPSPWPVFKYKGIHAHKSIHPTFMFSQRIQRRTLSQDKQFMYLSSQIMTR